jgi:hypothetical protein
VPIATIADPRLSDGHYRTLNALISFADQNGKCWPSVAQIAERARKTRSTIFGHLRDLEELGYLTRAARYGKGGRTSNEYHILPALLVQSFPASGSPGGAVQPALLLPINGRASASRISDAPANGASRISHYPRPEVWTARNKPRN